MTEVEIVKSEEEKETEPIHFLVNKQLFEITKTAKKLSDEIKIEIEEDKLKMIGIDESKVMLYEYTQHTPKPEGKSGEAYVFSTDLLSRASKFKADEYHVLAVGDSVCVIGVKDGKKRKICGSAYGSGELLNLSYTVDDFKGKTTIQITKSNLKDIADIEEAVVLTIQKGTLVAKSISELSRFNEEILLLEPEIAVAGIDEDETIKTAVTTDYLRKAVDMLKGAIDPVLVYVENDKPILIEGQTEYGTVRIVIAPREIPGEEK